MKFGTRDLLISHQTYLQSSKIPDERLQNGKTEPSEEFVTRICQQAKLISQLITFIWRWSDKNHMDEQNRKNVAAKKLKDIFDRPKQIETGELTDKLMGLLTTDIFSDSSNSELLKTVFAKYSEEQKKELFPIFSEYERKRYALFVDVERFHGQVGDPTLNNPGILSFTIPYPPRPQLGEATVSEQELEKWLNNTDITHFVADNPYIPTSCS
ncbi:MAG: hypothetical protein GPJ00_04020 [Microcystis aeruginosa W13-18]|nr:hypothetical protein [Microcystis aeruginosa W13-18]NCR35406.1 hypothetical protein [Microcystis aeruginosa S11-05]NCR48913.1 hypothetical protein [Microcystis aeruginosa S11-01]